MFCAADSQWSFDNVRVLSDDLSSSATMEYDDANEMTSRTVDGLQTTYTYDDWGRLTRKDMGSYAAVYGYKYGDKLTGLLTNFPGKAWVGDAHSGDGKRIGRNINSVWTYYKWGVGFDLVNEDTDQGVLTRTYYGRLADVAGTDPVTGVWRYYHHDHLGSPRRVTDQSRTLWPRTSTRPTAKTCSPLAP